MIKVYFEAKGHAELICVFFSEEQYQELLPFLEIYAEINGGVITESVGNDA